MTKLLIAGLMTIIAWNASAEINCLVEKGLEVLEVRVIDTFVDRTAFITITTPTIRIPTVSIPVNSFEKNKFVTFMNDEHDFHLAVNKLYSQRRLPPIYKAQLSYGDLATEMDCIVE